MTAPSRIPHGEAVRNAVRVEWMRLETGSDLIAAWHWLDAHGVRGLVLGDCIAIYGAGGRILGRLGDRLTYHSGSGEFSVWPEDRYREAHQEVSA